MKTLANNTFNKLDLIMHQILMLKTLLIFMKNLLQNYIFFLVIDATLASENPLDFRSNLSERI